MLWRDDLRDPPLANAHCAMACIEKPGALLLVRCTLINALCGSSSLARQRCFCMQPFQVLQLIW